MVDHMFPFFNVWPWLKKRLLRLKWRSVDSIANIKLPLLLMTSVKDEIVPTVLMHDLRKAATGAVSCDFHEFKDATHNDIWMKGGAQYWQAKKSFIDKVAHSVRSAPTAAATPILIVRADLQTMKGAQIKKLAQEVGLNIAGCAEKGDFIEKFEQSAGSNARYALCD